ncbi:hypothetical protein ACHAWU_010296 [Discostella pseudostelligera]|uniref:Methyltransferase small domain-containing protein n=1 Tax=Discostella pseudostelligera TaxID=259834 RepID=A0ABD3N6E2_9STRA
MAEPSHLIQHDINQEVDAALNLSHQLSHHLQQLRRLNQLSYPTPLQFDYGNDGDPNHGDINFAGHTSKDGSAFTSVERYASTSLLNSAIQCVDFLEQYLESIINYSWEDDDDNYNDVVQSQQRVTEVLHGIVILREYIARCSLLQSKYNPRPSSDIHYGVSVKNDDYNYANCDYEDGGVGVEETDDICDHFLSWAIAAKRAGLIEDCIQAHLCRMNIEPRWKQLDAVRLLGVVDNKPVDKVGEERRGCIIEIEEVPTKGMFETVPHQVLPADKDGFPSLPTQNPSMNAILLGKRVHGIFHSAGYNYWNCRRMLVDVLSSPDEELSPNRWNRIYSANSFFEHRHEAFHAFYETKTAMNRVGSGESDEPDRVLAGLYLFGISLERTRVSSAIGEENTITLIDAGLVRNHPADATYLVSEVQIYPLDTGIFEWRTEEEASSSNNRVYCMTDWSMESLRSPRNAAMTIGYDSLELLALTSGKDIFSPTTGGDHATSRVLDLCCGCGIQGIFAAKRSSSWSNPSVRTELLAMDVNTRAVRFAMANACLNSLVASDEHGSNSFKYSSVEADVYEPVGGISDVDRSSRQIGRFDYILCNPPFVAVPIAKNVAGMAPALYAVGGGRDGMNVLRCILEQCFDVLADGINRQLLMVTELPNIETSCALLSSMLPSTARVRVAYIEDDVETTDDYAKEREVEAGFDIATRDWNPSSNQIVNRALALITISRAITSGMNLFCFRTELESEIVPASATTDEEDQFLTHDGIHFVRKHLL